MLRQILVYLKDLARPIQKGNESECYLVLAINICIDPLKENRELGNKEKKNAGLGLLIVFDLSDAMNPL